MAYLGGGLLSKAGSESSNVDCGTLMAATSAPAALGDREESDCPAPAEGTDRSEPVQLGEGSTNPAASSVSAVH